MTSNHIPLAVVGSLRAIIHGQLDQAISVSDAYNRIWHETPIGGLIDELVIWFSEDGTRRWANFEFQGTRYHTMWFRERRAVPFEEFAHH